MKSSSMIEQQLDVECPLVQASARQALRSFSHCGMRDAQRVDLVGFSALAGDLSPGSHQLGSNADDPLSAPKHKTLEPAGDVTAIRPG